MAVDVSERSARVGLATLPSMYPRRLSALLRHHSGVEAVETLRCGGKLHPESGFRPDVIARLRSEVAGLDIADAVGSCESAGISVVVRGDPLYPARLLFDDEAPEVIFVRGDLRVCERRSVAIVGTRRATAAGRATAADLGRGLAERGIAIVSGLASGIDAASHRGADSVDGAAPIAVVGSGLDVVYPRANEALWQRVATTGLLMSEWGPGVAPEAWHFPLRNRIIAGLAEVVVVVESRETGGSLITARAALDRGVDVLAVPGSVHCRAATGTNRLIADGAGVVCSVDDVVDVLELTSSMPSPPPRSRCEQLSLDLYGDLAAAVHRYCLERPLTIDQLVELTGSSLIEVARAVVALEHDGLLADSNGWLESVGSRLLSRG